VFTRIGRGSDCLRGALACDQATQQSEVTPDRGCKKYLISPTTFSLITCWYFLLAKAGWKFEARMSIDVVSTT
jgi:hypothetical protein